MKKSSNFDLQIDRVAGGFRAKVTGTPLGTAEHIFSAPPDGLNWKDLLEGSWHRLREIETEVDSSRKTAEEIGRDLFREVFAGEILIHWRMSRFHAQDRGLRLRLHTRDPEIASWPWELLFDPKDSAPLSVFKDTPVIRYPEMQGGCRLLWTLPPLHILVMTAEPSGCVPLAAQEEWEDLKRSLATLEKNRLVNLSLLKGGSLVNLCEQLRGVHVLHFIGHGTFNEQLKEGELLFEDDHGGPDRVSGRKLATALRNRQDLRLIVLNACEGARGGESAFTGVAESLVRSGVPAVVAMKSTVTDRAALLFSRHFYEEVAQELPIDAALAEARNAIYTKDRQGIEWATPVLFMRSPDGHLFRFLTSWHRMLKLVTSLFLLLVGGFVRPVPEYPFTRRTDGPYAPVPSATTPALPSTASIEGCPVSEFLGMTFVRLPAGTFTMGLRRSKNNRAHQVKITRPFCMSIHEVTQGQWEAVMKSNPSHEGDGRLPVGNVSHDDVQTFVEQLNQLEPGANYRLSTEAQWEYGARAEASSRYSFGNDPDMLLEYGNCQSLAKNDGFDGAAPVGSFKANKWGLHDMYGNVSEWVADWYAPYPSGSADDPKGPSSGEKRVRRGGSWELSPERCTSAERTESAPSYHSRDVGFRLVRDIVMP